MKARVEAFGAGDVAVGHGDDVVFIDDVLENVGAEQAEAGVELAFGYKQRGAVERTFVEQLGGEDGTGGVLQLGQGKRESTRAASICCAQPVRENAPWRIASARGHGSRRFCL